MTKLKNASFGTRTISGAVFLVVMLGMILLSHITFFALFFAVAVSAINEFYGIAKKRGIEPQKKIGVVIGIIVMIVALTLSSYGWRELTTVARVLILSSIGVLFLPFFIELYRKRERPLANISVTLAGVIYVVLPISLIIAIGTMTAEAGYMTSQWAPLWRGVTYSPLFVVCYLVLIWVNDIGAYLFGVVLGRRKLFERISPNKSWEGFFGGLVTAIAAGALIGWLTAGTLQQMLIWGGAAVIVVATGVLGDLVESMFKREAEVKDSGKMMPGHGGFLDRFDAMLLSAPFIFIYFTIFIVL